MYFKPGVITKELGIAGCTLKKLAREGRLPPGAVLSTDGGHFTYNIEIVREWMLENYMRLTKTSRARARR